MSNTAVFCSESFLRAYTPISSNVDIDFIWPHLLSFQNLHIQDILGSKLYNTLQTKVYNATALNSYEQALLELCRMALVWGTVQQMLPFLAIQIRNKGVMENNAENATNTSLENLKYLRHEAQKLFEFYGQRIVDYLCDNGNQFPDYTNPDNPIFPNPNSTYDSDLYLGPSNGGEEWDAIKFWRKYIK